MSLHNANYFEENSQIQYLRSLPEYKGYHIAETDGCIRVKGGGKTVYFLTHAEIPRPITFLGNICEDGITGVYLSEGYLIFHGFPVPFNIFTGEIHIHVDLDTGKYSCMTENDGIQIITDLKEHYSGLVVAGFHIFREGKRIPFSLEGVDVSTQVRRVFIANNKYEIAIGNQKYSFDPVNGVIDPDYDVLNSYLDPDNSTIDAGGDIKPITFTKQAVASITSYDLDEHSAECKGIRVSLHPESLDTYLTLEHNGAVYYVYDVPEKRIQFYYDNGSRGLEEIDNGAYKRLLAEYHSKFIPVSDGKEGGHSRQVSQLSLEGPSHKVMKEMRTEIDAIVGNNNDDGLASKWREDLDGLFGNKE